MKRPFYCIVCSKPSFNNGRVNYKTCSDKCSKIRRALKIRGYNKKYLTRTKVWQRSMNRKVWRIEYEKKNRCKFQIKENMHNRKHPERRLYHVLRATLNQRIRAKKVSSKYLGYTPMELRHHLERNFKPGMSWGNYGRSGWHIDHIKPLSSFDFFDNNGSINLAEIIKAMSLENLQPLWAFENISKHDKIILEVA